jgi:CoA-transferase family III
VSPAPVLAMLRAVTDQLAEVTALTGSRVRADPAELLTGRAALAGFTRQGRVSAGGASRLLRSAGGWCAVTLSRPDDEAAVPAILGALGDPAAPISGVAGHGPGGSRGANGAAWDALEAAARRHSAAALAGAAQLLGVPAAALPREPPDRRTAPWPPWRVSRIAAPSPGARLAGAVVADLSSMWAGPLCARLLGLAGADVIKVETPGRPDGARAGDPEFFGWLHAGHRSLLADFTTEAGRATLARLLSAADVVIEASRPRALANLGLAPESIPHRDGQVWLSITGHGRSTPERVAFGDDAAVAGGLVGWTAGDAGDADPVFCADAIADPLTGACGALAVATSVAAGGGQLIDLAMRSVAASFAAAPGCDHGPHDVRPDGTVTCHLLGRTQPVLLPGRPRPDGRAAAPELGADTAAVLDWLAAPKRPECPECPERPGQAG